jgi:hypothetical protein
MYKILHFHVNNLDFDILAVGNSKIEQRARHRLAEAPKLMFYTTRSSDTLGKFESAGDFTDSLLFTSDFTDFYRLITTHF